MSDQNNNKFDGYITLGNALTESFDKISIPNLQLIDGISKGLIDAIKPITEYNLTIAKIWSDDKKNDIMKQQRMINAMIEPLTTFAKSITEI